MNVLKNLSKRERVLLIVAGSCITLAVVYRLVMIPVREKNKRMDVEIQQLSAQLKVLQTVASLSEGVGAEYARLKKKFTETGTDKEKMSSLQAMLEKMCTDSGVSLDVLKPRQVKNTEWSKTFYVEMKIEGEVSQLMSFLVRLNNADGACRVDNLQLSRKEKDVKKLKASLLVSKLVFADGIAAK